MFRATSELRIALCALLVVCLVPSLCHAQASPRELREEASMFMSQGDYMAAIPPLQQLIQLLGRSTTSSIVSSMEMVYYNLGLCYFFVGQFDQAHSAFGAYNKKYRRGMKRRDAHVYMADSLRFKGDLEKALAAYESVLRSFQFDNDMIADLHSSMARCHLADGNWPEAISPLKVVYQRAPDFLRRNWAATLLSTAFLKERDLDKIYALVPYLLRPESLASRSVAFNLAALEAADELFAEEFYRDALWLYRIVYPHDTVVVRSEEYLEKLKWQADRIRNMPSNPRYLMRLQESIGELEAEMEAMAEVENYDLELYHRIAMGYMELMRYREAREIFLYIHKAGDDREAEEALFLAFRCSSFIRPWDRAFELGEEYIKKYPAGEYFDVLTLAMGQMYARLQDWPRVIEHLTRTLDMSPKHESAAECMFLVGYASFMEEKFDDAIQWLTRMLKQFPGNELEDEGIYWSGMAHLFNQEYEKSAVRFDQLSDDFPDSTYITDARFRRAVCDYGLSRYEQAGERLVSFIAAYPTNQLTGEAVMMSGDVAGALGELDAAVEFYQRAMSFEGLNIEFYNHSAFQAGRILADAEKHDELRSHFGSYIDRDIEGSNIPLAVYWIGVALWNSGEEEGAMNFYREAVERFGSDRTAVGIDMILDEWIGRIKRSPKEPAEEAWKRLASSMEKAMASGNKTLALRFKRVALYDKDLKPSSRQRIMQELGSAQTLEHASPAVLQLMLDTANKEGKTDFAVAVADHIIETFTETDYALDARMTLAQKAITQARDTESRSETRKLHEEAIRHLEVISAVYASSPEAGTALLNLGTIHRDMRKFDKADECYKSVLGVKEWRNLWPEALYGRGECAFDRKLYGEASAYYERIYVLYGHHVAWVAKAYLRRAECLKRLYQVTAAREVLEEMLANEDLAKLPEAAEGRELMRKLRGSS